MALDLEFALMMRAMAARGLDDSVFLHCSMRSPMLVKNKHLLINIARPRPFWATTSLDSVVVDEDGVDATSAGIKPNAQFWIHRDIYKSRPEFNCILHVHTPDTIAAAAIGILRQVHQGAALFTEQFLGFMPYKGLNRYDGLVEAFGHMRYAVLMEGHGAMVGGRTPGEAFEILINLQDACIKESIIPMDICVFNQKMVDTTHAEWIRGGRPFGAHSWPAERDALYESIKRSGEAL